MATKTKTPPKTPKPLTDAQHEQIERCLSILDEHGNPAQNTGELQRALELAGMKFTRPTGTNKVAAAKISASATSGMHDALRLWGNKARRALLSGEV